MRSAVSLRAAWRFIRRPRVFDTTIVVLFGLLSIAGVVSILGEREPNDAMAPVLTLVAALPLLLRRGHPVAVSVATMAVDLVGISLGTLTSSSLPTMVALYSLGRYATGRRALLLTTGAAVVVHAAPAVMTAPGPQSAVAGVVPILVVGLGQFVRLRTELRERERREALDGAVRAERRRIARELHDVVAHHLTVINALVGGARSTMAARPGDPRETAVREALVGAERSAREALTEMRTLLHVLRADDGSAADAATGVGAEGLPALVEQARGAGLPASLKVSGTAVALPSAVDHAVYRIAQEALTNTRKHATGARASVRLRYRPDAVEIEVLDDGINRQAQALVEAPPAGPGFGLGGMAERVALCGGWLETGPRPEGGFRVHARIPLPTLENPSQ